jgi:hypothetical protein
MTVSWLVDPEASKLTVRTHATGMLARLAHNLELEASTLRGRASVAEEAFSAEIFVPVASLRVAGTLRGDRVHGAKLTASDRAEIERKLREEVLAGTVEVHAFGRGASRDRADITVEIASGKSTIPATLRVTEEASLLHVAGRVELSLKRLRVPEIKGPLGAFRVSDAVQVLFAFTLRPEG